jgi:hypothetical protein
MILGDELLIQGEELLLLGEKLGVSKGIGLHIPLRLVARELLLKRLSYSGIRDRRLGL